MEFSNAFQTSVSPPQPSPTAAGETSTGGFRASSPAYHSQKNWHMSFTQSFTNSVLASSTGPYPSRRERSSMRLNRMSPLESSFSHPPPSSPTVPRVFRDKWEGSDLDTWAREVNGIKVVRRADGLVNGTKLLNCTNMTRGRRDGILKNERSRTVIKVGSHALKGVWIPLDRAQELSHKHGLDRDMWPLLEPDVNAYTFSGSSLDDFPSEEGPSESSSTGSDFGYNQPASAGVQSESAMATPSARPSSGPALHGIHAYSLAPLHSPLYPTSGPPLMPSSYPLQGQQTQLTNELGLTIPPATFAMQPQNTAARYSSTPSMLPSFQQFDHFSQPHDLYSHTQAEHDGAWYQQSATAPAPSTSSSSSHSYAHDASNWKVSGVDFDQFINEPWRPEFPNS